MAASDQNHDYTHLVKNYIEDHGDNEVELRIINFSTWESLNGNRNERLPDLNSLLDDSLDLVTIELGENVRDLTTYEQDYTALIAHIKEKAPDAIIIIVGDFWNNTNRTAIERKVANATGVLYASLDGIADNKSYYCGTGTVVYDADGGKHIVDSEFVAAHPGDRGMQGIANRIIQALGM